MVDAMKHFDANVNAMLSSGQVAVESGKSLNLNGVTDHVKAGILASGG